MLHASSSNNHSLFSFGRNGAPNDLADSTTSSFEFLPSVNFDDLQSSLESASTEFKLTQFPLPSGHGTIIDERALDKMTGQSSGVTQNGATIRAVGQPNATTTTSTRPTRSASILRRSSISGRQVSNGSIISVSSSNIADAPTAPAAMRNRRQSHYPPVSSTNIGKPPRKSIGPGIIDADYGSRVGQKRRPSLISNASDKVTTESTRASMEITGGQSGENARNFTTSRATKARSVQPAPRISANLSTSASGTSSLVPDQNRVSTAFPRSPRANKGSTPNSARRMSVMPGTHNSHASGLGARTISPTDAQRMKRLSIHPSQNPPQTTNAPPPPSTTDARPQSRSPSMIPRKTSTPSSLRTTPEVTTRKSYSSGLSVGSTNSLNTHRTSTGSIQRALSQGGPTSRLPAPKSLNVHNPAPGEEEEDVPPVPAIPKVYESPKDSPAELSFLEKRKSTYTFDSSSIHSNSTGTPSGTPSQEPTRKDQRKTTVRRHASRKTLVGPTSDIEHKLHGSQSKKNLQPLRLPPLNLGPLSMPTKAKIEALRDQGEDDRKLSPPPARSIPKTPTTPMTASKSTFFSRARLDKDSEKSMPRSSSSIHHSRLESPIGGNATSSSESPLGSLSKKQSHKANISPFLSSSVPKSNDTLGLQTPRSKTITDVNNTIIADTPAETRPHQKPSGPRAQKSTKPAKSPPPRTSPEEPPTPSSMSNLRRKLSLSWKRSASKSSHHASMASVDKASEKHARQDSMPPPRIPVSASMNISSTKASSPSHTTKTSGTYLESRRRKSSASSLTTMFTDKNRGDGWTSSKKDAGNNSMIETSSQPRTSSMQKILRPRPSVASIKRQDSYTADLDKDDLVAEDEMKKLAMRRKETEMAARTLDALRKRATPKERVGPHEAIRIAMLNIYERGEIVDYNDVYFCGTQNASKVVGDLNSNLPNFGYDDERGDYSIISGDHLAYRYEIVDVLGKGSFGQVVRCIDHKTGVLVAVKIIRNKKRFHQQALVEVNILQKLREWDPHNRHSMVNFTHSFYFRGHLCISTELLDMNLYEFIKSNAFRGFSLKLIRRFTKQMLSSLAVLKQHKVIHCDLKPENILLRHPMHSEIKVIDFGSSCFENEKVYTYIQSRFYRSPEVILGMTYGLPIDMWSLGCILAELYTGVPIFPGENEQEQLACIMEVFGPPEKHLIEKSTRKKLFFDSMGKPRLTVSSKGRRRRPSSKTLQQAIKCDDEPFLDFLARCLRWDPDRRLKPEEAIRHEFITGQKTSVPVPRTRESSPIKRHNTISTPRPLPDPPAVAAKAGPNLRPRETTTVSPLKPAAGSRRTSAFTATTAAASGKRTSGGPSAVQSTAAGVSSNLPRVAGRTASGKQDLAAAGANVAMSRRA
ncbi:serine/threonine protein kinase, CMGC, dual-specificity [Parahypoxylon ruwenzoriense]